MGFTFRTIVISLMIALTPSCNGAGSTESGNQAHGSSDTIQAKQLDNAVITIAEDNTDIAEDNTDLASIENIERPSESKIVNPAFPLDKLLGIWTYDPEGPHADFDLNKDWFYVVDYDGNGEMPYVINKDSITVYYEDDIAKGRIEKATGDSLFIAWDGQPAVISVRWKN